MLHRDYKAEKIMCNTAMENKTQDLSCTEVLTVNDTHFFSRKNRLELQSCFLFFFFFFKLFNFLFGIQKAVCLLTQKFKSFKNPISRYVCSVFAHLLTNKFLSKVMGENYHILIEDYAHLHLTFEYYT